MKVTLLAHTPEPEKTVAAAARLCYSPSDIGSLMDKMDEEKASRFLEMLSEIGHESPIEHAVFTFGIEGVSRSMLAQNTRHRIASFSVQSQRYVRKDHFEYIVPPAIAADPEAAEEYRAAMEEAETHYEKLAAILKKNHAARLTAQGMDETAAIKKAEKIAIEDARFVLPNSCDTRMVVTMNARSLRNFFRERCCNRAQWEIHAVADEMLRLVLEVAPHLFARSGPPCLNGACPEGKMSCGKLAEVRETYRRMKEGV